MFENIASAIKKILPKGQNSLYLILLLLLVFAIYFYSNSKTNFFDSMDTGVSTSGEKAVAASVPVPTAPVTSAPAPQVAGAGYALQPVANPSDLLPADNTKWSALNPNAMKQGDIMMPDLLQAGYHIGLDTIGQTLRNANQQLRSDPIIPVQQVGPWNQSTMEPDLGRVPLEIGR